MVEKWRRIEAEDIHDIKRVASAVDGGVHHFRAHPLQRGLSVRVDGVRKLVDPHQMVRVQVLAVPDLYVRFMS